MIVDVSCDKHGGIETSVPTTIENPTYYEESVLHYAVDHTPALFYKTFSYNNSQIIIPYLDQLIEGSFGVTMKNINAGMIERSLIPLPPLTLQREFAAFVEKVDKLKDIAKKSVEQIDTLYRAKLQEYFG